MADASPNSAKDLEIVEIVEDSTKDLEIVEDGRETGNEGEKSNGDGRDGEEGIVRKDREEDETTDCDGEDGVVKKNPEEDETIENHVEETEASKSDKGSEKGANDDESLKVCTSAKDTRSIRSRVFVGHLNTNNATRHDLERLFSSCGKIEAISMLHGYGFVQFDNEESARKAIEDVHGTPFMGMKLVVDKPAAWKKLDGENPRDPKPWPKDSKKPYIPDHDDDDYYRERRRGRRREPDYDYDYDYYGDLPSRYRDPYYERYLEMRYMEERLAERYRYDRYYERYAPPPSRYADYYRSSDRYDYMPPSRGYDRPRDDDYERERRPFDSYGY